jgi:flagellar basal-body rod protein FlgB
MDLSKLPLLAMATKRMGWLARRQEVLSQNVANADTPDYVPHDLKAQNFRSMLRAAKPVAPVEMARTDASHIEPLRHPPKFSDGKEKDPYEVAPAGNAVVLEEQLMKVSETQTDYRMATTIYRKHINMIKDALGRHSS